MAVPIRVLIVEDTPDDAELMTLRLSEEGFLVDGQRVEDEPGYLAALTPRPDVILADWSLPHFSGLRALQLLRERSLDIPFIIVSGSIGEETAVDAIRRGAYDYVLKDRLGRLGQSVCHALEDKQLRDERKRVEEALRQSEIRYRRLHESMMDAFVSVDMGGRLRDFNEVYREMLGFEGEELPGLTYRDLTPESWHAFEQEIVEKQVILRGYSDIYEKEYRRKDGTIFPVELRTNLLRDDGGNPVGMWAVVRDISERRRTEEALRRSEAEAVRLARENATVARIGKIVSSSPDLDVALQEFGREMRGILPFDRLTICLIYATGYGVTELYSAGIDIPGLRDGATLDPQGTLTEDVVRSRQGRIVHMDDRGATGQRFPGLLPVYDAGLRSSMAVPLVSRDQVIGVIHFQSLSPGLYEDTHLHLAESITSQIAGAIDNARLFKEHRQVSRALFESQKKFHNLFDEAPVGYHEFDAEGRIVRVNRTELEMLGYSEEEMLGRFIWEFVAESGEARRVIQEKISGKQPTGSEFERTFLRKDGTPIPVLLRDRPIRDAQGRIVGMRSTVQDITERKKAEQEMAALQDQFRQAQRMEAIGQLAGGIAHDFNNLLTVIKGYCQLAMEDLPEEDPLRESLEQIFNAGTRAANLTRQLLAFSRRQVLEFKTVDLNDLVGDLQKMLRRLLGENIEIFIRPGENLGRIRTDPGQMEQVLLNLVVNARDAMPLGGRLVIETGNGPLDDATCRTHPDVSPGDYISLSVSDTGCGMAPEVRERVFEPFFTTKEKGKGTGLGLSTVYGIVKQSGGHISIDSEPGHGTTVKIYLPRTNEVPGEDRAPIQAPSVLTGTETVLLVEDEEVVRKLATRILKKQGYRVLEASSGSEALLICERHAGPIHLVLTDVIMPGMSGPQLVERLKQIRKDVAVLYMSGYTDEAIAPHGVLHEGVQLLAKPFTTDSLAKKVREVLDGVGEKSGRQPDQRGTESQTKSMEQP